MAFGLTPAGTITKEQTLHTIRRFPVNEAENIVKGNVLDIDADGNLINAATDNTDVLVPSYVALEPANNTNGSDGDISCPVAVPGHFVTVTTDNPINPGDKVKRSTTIAGRIEKWESGTDLEEIHIGIYYGKEGGIITKSVTSADDFAETFTDDADFVPVPATTDDIVEIELRD